jgi:hypothetical protein
MVYDAFDKGLEASKHFTNNMLNCLVRAESFERDIEQTLSRLSYSTNLAEAVRMLI